MRKKSIVKVNSNLHIDLRMIILVIQDVWKWGVILLYVFMNKERR